MKKMNSARVTLWISRAITVLLLAMIFLLPVLVRIYGIKWTMNEAAQRAIPIAYYLCLVLILPAMWNIDALLRNILKKQVFIRENVLRIRRVCWCCAGVGLICFPAAHFFTALYFLSVIMLFLAFVIRVVEDVMAAAVELREENDLTV